MPATWIGICVGDVTGIGPEVTLKALAALQPPSAAGASDLRFLILGDRGWLERANQSVRLELPAFTGYDAAARVAVLDSPAEALPANLAPGAAPAARAAINWLSEGARRCLRRELAALVTAPLSKQAVIRSGLPFVGQTEFLSALAGTDRTVMMLLGEDNHGRWLRVGLVTTHLPLREVPGAISPGKLRLAIERCAEACALLRLPRARVAVCGLNPHAGEGGALGREEVEIIGPTVEQVRAQGLDAIGPLSADTVFHQALRGDYDAVVAMYHDQGLAPLKLAAFDSGVNWTLGLPFIRTSPDHGTAYDIAGQDRANPSSMRAAIQLAIRLAASQARPE